MNQESLLEPRKGQLGQEGPVPAHSSLRHMVPYLCSLCIECQPLQPSPLLLGTAVTKGCPAGPLSSVMRNTN